MRKRPTPPKETDNARTPKALGEAKLRESGLTLADAKTLGISFLTATQTKALCPKSRNFFPLKSLKLDYFEHKGKPLSDMVGRDGAKAERSLLVKASAFTLPFCDWGKVHTTLSNANETRPVVMSPKA